MCRETFGAMRASLDARLLLDSTFSLNSSSYVSVSNSEGGVTAMVDVKDTLERYSEMLVQAVISKLGRSG